MAWDVTTPETVTRNRLRFSPPEHVYAALEDYGAYSIKERFFSGDPALEQALLDREDRLIDLGLARYGLSYDAVVPRLYKRAMDGSGDGDFDRAIRLSCLANPRIGAVLNSKMLIDAETPEKNELHRMAVEGDGEELTILMHNRGARYLLQTVYGRLAPLQDIPLDRWQMLVRYSAGNPGLNWDDTNNSGPDLIAWDLKKALRGLLGTAPTTSDWVRLCISCCLT
jgi:hypothetical protein